MNDRIYLFLIGFSILIALYIESAMMIFIVVVIMLVEGTTGWTLPWIARKISKDQYEPVLLQLNKKAKFNFEALRVMRLSVAIVVLVSYLGVQEYNMDVLWFFLWFFGFAVLGAAVSGVCPIYLLFRWVGFK